MSRIIVIEDDGGIRHLARQALQGRGHDVVAVDSDTALGLLSERTFDVVVAGIPESASEFAMETISPELVCLSQPWSIDELVTAVGELEERRAIRTVLDDASRLGDGDPEIIGTSSAIRDILARVAAVSANDAPVLLTGESGTGKELLARRIHQRSARHDGPLVTVNCAAFPETLIESELFGYERGAFTGALQRRDGRFKAAEGGTLFLDEINSLSLASQAKLLRVLEHGRYHPLGTNVEVVTDVRLISATNQDLASLVACNRFRGDLYYRIKVLDLDVPPLRQREGDLPVLISHFLCKYGDRSRQIQISPRAWAALLSYSFPGNVRELSHAIQRAVVLACGADIELGHLPPEIAAVSDGPPDDSSIRPLYAALLAFEREYIQRALDAAGGNKTRAARLLGISRKHLWEKMRRLARAHE